MSMVLKRSIFKFKTKYLHKLLAGFYNFSQKEEFAVRSSSVALLKKKNDLVAHAVKFSSFYKEKYEGVFSNELKNELDFEKLPVLTRMEIKNNFPEIVSKKINQFFYPKIHTSGSTGVPITVLHNRYFAHAQSQWRLLKWWGLKPYENKAFIYRNPRSSLTKFINALSWWPTKRIFLAGSVMNAKEIGKFIQDFNRVKPTLLQGYVDVVYEFALFLQANNLNIHPPKAVWVTAAPLIETQRNLMQEIFKAPVYDQYGCSEIPYVAAECSKQNGLHILEDLVYVECVDENNEVLPPNTWGRIVLTDLTNYSFPLIRYKIGDFGRLLDSQCSCGIQTLLMDNVRGRESEFICTPSGIKIYGNFLTSLFDSSKGVIKNYQIIQNKDYSVELKYVSFENNKVDEILSMVIEKLKIETNSEIKIFTTKVCKAPKTEGKTKLIINNL